MKKIILVIAITFFVFGAIAQVPSSPIPSNSMKCNIYSNNFAVANMQSSAGNNMNEIAITSGELRFNAVPGAMRDVRLFQNLGSTLGNTWFSSFTFRVTDIGNSGGALIPFVVTAGNNAPSNPANQPAVQTNQDAIGVSCTTPHMNTAPITIRPFVKNGSTVISTSNCEIQIQQNITYTISIERISSTSGRFRVVNNNVVVGNCCFVIPSDVTGLNVIQSSNAVQADANRRISGIADNFCIRSTDTIPICCIGEIQGNTQICATNQAASYSVEGSPSSNYNWSLPSGISFTGQGTNSINITNWGTLHGDVTLSVTRECNCQTFTSIIVVSVRRDLNEFTPFELIDQETNGVLITKIKLQASNIPSSFLGAIQWWNIFEAANCTSGDYSILNESSSPVMLRMTGFGTDYTVTTPPSPDLLKTKCYIIKHGMYYENGVCGWSEKRMKLMVNGSFLKATQGNADVSKQEKYQSQMINPK